MKYFVMFIYALSFVSCANHYPLDIQTKASVLEKEFENIDKKVDKNEAKNISYEIYAYAKTLKKEYELVSPPLFHNLLVNMGVKKRGLCWHFAYDLLSHVKKQKYQSFDYYIVGANINEYWEEHNALLVTCQGCVVQKGVIIDLWRNSAEPFYVKYAQDKEYDWSIRGGKR